MKVSLGLACAVIWCLAGAASARPHEVDVTTLSSGPCPPGYTRRPGVCVVAPGCPNGGRKQGDQCVEIASCPRGFNLVGARCVAPMSCPPGALMTAGPLCWCPKGASCN